MITYFEVLLYFIVPPIVLLSIIGFSRREKIQEELLNPWAAIGILSLVAFIYTTPWDNYLVREGVWFYDESLVSGIIFYYVPLEEYLFFILETLLVGLLVVNLYSDTKLETNTSWRFNLVVTLLLIGLWTGCLMLFLYGESQWTYLTLILIWALIPISIQSIFGADVIWSMRKMVFSTIIISTMYLSLVDAIAINSGTWTIEENSSLSNYKLGIMPLEEILFFFITTTLVVFGTILATSPLVRQRFFGFVNQIKRTIDFQNTGKYNSTKD